MIDIDALLKYIEHDDTADVARSGEISAVIRLLRDEVKAWRSGHERQPDGQWINRCCGCGACAIDIAITSATDASLKL